VRREAPAGLAEGQTVDLGIRPEHVEISGLIDHTTPENTQKTSQLTIEVNLVEPLGRETLIRGSLPTSDVTLNVQAPQIGVGVRAIASTSNSTSTSCLSLTPLLGMHDILENVV
jgi:ABC-type sugar transport system ATPase subunit